MYIGTDFDNTLVRYDRIFHELAIGKGLVPSKVPVDKAAVRGRVRTLPDGENLWIQLQGEVYGSRMEGAVLAEGAGEFLQACRRRKVPVCIISHKTRYPVLGPRAELRQAALQWMESNGFFDPDGFGLIRDEVFFESTRAEKLARIAERDCTHFIDDLVEVFQEASFPQTVKKLLLFPQGEVAELPGVERFRSWNDIVRRLFGT